VEKLSLDRFKFLQGAQIGGMRLPSPPSGPTALAFIETTASAGVAQRDRPALRRCLGRRRARATYAPPPNPARPRRRRQIAREHELGRAGCAGCATRRGLSQDALAYEAEVSRSYLSQLEKGAFCASLKIVGRLAEALDAEPAELLKMPAGKG
jgi:DNA-binding XRE family transcriptional regulator